MSAFAHPAELSETISPRRRVEEIRNLYCAGYDACLDEALRLGWSSWTCVGCERFAAPAVRRRASAARSVRTSRPIPEHA
jgi:hypothetical protein